MWAFFRKLFKKKYLSERYYDEKAKEFNKQKLGQLTMDRFISKFFNLQHYVLYLKEEKDKVYRFINHLSQAYKDNIEFDAPETLD